MGMKYSEYKSSEVEWIGMIPKHWDKDRIKYIGFMYGGLTGKSGDDFRKDEEDPTNRHFIPFTNICNNTYIDKSDLKLVSINEKDNQNIVKKGDIFFMMTSENQEDLGKTSVLKDDLGEVYLNTFCKGFRIKNKSVNPYFLNYLLNSNPYRVILSIEGNGFTRINLRQDRVSDFVVFTPPQSEQEEIVKYLDEKTFQIDNLISLTEKKIELLKQKRTSLINDVIKRGVDPKVELKDSGVEWIGLIPKHWKIEKLGYHISILSGFPFKSELFDPFEGFPILRIRDITSGKCETFYKGEYDKSQIVSNNDLLVGMDGDFTLRWWENGDVLLNQRCCCLKTNNTLLKRFLFYFLPENLKIVNDLTYFTTVKHLSNDDIKRIKISLPPLPEQEEIVQYIDTQTTEIDNLISIEQRRIETLKEYRQSMISEVITGKLKVIKKIGTI